MKKLVALVSALALVVLGAASGNAGPTQFGFASDHVQYVNFVPFEVGTATGARLLGHYLYVTSWKNISIYDVSDKANPQLVSITPLAAGKAGDHPVTFENEDVPTNGKILIFSESIPGSVLHVWDVEDKSNPVEIAELPGAGDHTQTCLLDCKWLYGSSGSIVDLRDPKHPKLRGNWQKLIGLQGGAHDETEVKPGFLVTSPLSGPIQYIDARDPLHPKVLASGTKPAGDPIVHSVQWPNSGNDKFMLVQGENNFQPRCGSGTDPKPAQGRGGFMTFSTANWQKTHTFTFLNEYKISNGDYVDGNPPVNELGCSAHWFHENPTFNNGGLVAAGWYEHGTRFLNIDSKGGIHEVGYFEPYQGSTSAAYWATNNLVYAIDYENGFYILKWTGKL